MSASEPLRKAFKLNSVREGKGAILERWQDLVATRLAAGAGQRISSRSRVRWRRNEGQTLTSVQTPWNAGSFVLTEHRTRRVGGASQPSESSEGCRLHTLERIERRKGSPVQQAVRPRRHTDQADLWTVPMCACPGPSTQREVGKCTRLCSEVLELGSPLVPPRAGGGGGSARKACKLAGESAHSKLAARGGTSPDQIASTCKRTIRAHEQPKALP